MRQRKLNCSQQTKSDDKLQWLKLKGNIKLQHKMRAEATQNLEPKAMALNTYICCGPEPKRERKFTKIYVLWLGTYKR